MDNFELICKLGSGGFSKVYKVRRKVDNQTYALKKVQILNLSEKQKLSSLNEIRVLASIKNKYIINYKEAFLDEKDCSLCLVMEYADGGDLANKIKEHKEKNEYFNEEDIWKIFIQLAKGLKSLHDMGIMHRDIKSSNIFLFTDKTAKLGDLNVCKILSNDILGHTQAGTPAYAAPEVWMERPYGLKSDIWSLGCVLYEMVTLRCPFREDNMVKLYNKVLVGEYKKIPNNFSEDLNWIIEHMINSDINKRFSCDEILNCEIVKKYLDQYMNKNIKCYSEKRINGYKINKKNSNNVSNKSYSKYNSIINEKKEDDGELLKTIYMPDNNLLYLRDQLPKANYNHEIQVNNSCKMYTSNQLNSEIAPSFIPNTNNLYNKKSDILKIKRNSYQPIYFRQRNLENNIMMLNKKNNKENKGKIKLKHINSALIQSEVNNNNYSSLENNNNNEINLRKVQNRKSDANLKNKIKDYLYMYEKEKEKEQHNKSILERNSQEKKFDIKNAIFVSSDKLKEILKTKKLKKNYFDNKDFQYKIKLKQNENKHLENNRYNKDETSIEKNKNKNIISNNINEIEHNILNNNKNICYNNIANANILYENNNNTNNNINNYIHKKRENIFINKKKKKSVDILPKIKLSHV